MDGLNVSATETMLLLALRQRNWGVALDIASKLAEKDERGFFKSVSSAILKMQNDVKAIFLLTLWTEISWEIKK